MMARYTLIYSANLLPEISKNLSKKRINLSKTPSLFLVRSPVGENLDTGGNTLLIAVSMS